MQSIFFKRSSKHNFALAFYNLGIFYEEKNKTEKSIKNFILASENEDEPLIYRNVTHYDRRLEISKMFIICFTNLKLVYYYFAIEKFDESKKYFQKVFNKFNLIDTELKYPFKFKLRINKESPNKFSNDSLSYIKLYILNFPLFNLINQSNMNLNSSIFHRNEIFQIKSKNDKKYDIKKLEMKSHSPLKSYDNNKKEKKKKNSDLQNRKKKNKIKKIEIIDIKNNEIMFEGPNKLFDFVINKSNSIHYQNQEFNSNIKEIFLNEINDYQCHEKDFVYATIFNFIWTYITR